MTPPSFYGGTTPVSISLPHLCLIILASNPDPVSITSNSRLRIFIHNRNRFHSYILDNIDPQYTGKNVKIRGALGGVPRRKLKKKLILTLS